MTYHACPHDYSYALRLANFSQAPSYKEEAKDSKDGAKNDADQVQGKDVVNNAENRDGRARTQDGNHANAASEHSPV